MNKNFISPLLFVYCISFFSVPSLAAENIRISVAEFPPYQSQSEPYFGSVNRIISAAFAYSDISVELGWFPWARAYSNASEPDWDGVAVAQRTPEREAEFYFSDPIFSVDKVFFHLKSYAFNWDTIEDLKGLHIGGGLGIEYGEEFQNAEQQSEIEVVRLTTIEQAISMMLLGRIEILPAAKAPNYYLLETKFTAQQNEFTHHSKPLQVIEYHLLLSKKDQNNLNRIELFNVGVQYLKDSGKLQQYLDEGFRRNYLSNM